MSFRQIPAALLAVALLGAVSRPSPLIIYSAPAGDRPAGADRVHPTDAVLPNGRIAAPAGTSIFVGAGTLGMALSPDGRYAILSNAGSTFAGSLPLGSTSDLVAGSSLTVVDLTSMRVAGVYQGPSASFFMGVAAAHDARDASQTIVLASDDDAGEVRVFDLSDAGTLTPEPPITLPARNGAHAVPSQIAVSADERTAYVADNLGNSVVEIDLNKRAAVRSVAVGDSPLYLAAGAHSLLASGAGLSSYAPLDPPAQTPQFANPAFDPARSSVLSVLGVSGDVMDDPTTVPLDRAPDGAQTVGGVSPGAAVVGKDGDAYVALTNVDRIAVVSLQPAPRVVRGLDLRLFPGAPYGAQPSSVALSPDNKRLYVALAGLNAVAVLDAKRPTRYRFGLIPTPWYPSAIALSPNGRFLYVAADKGIDGWGMLQRVDLKHTSLMRTTLAALRYNRAPGMAKHDPVIPPLRSYKRSDAIDHVVYVSIGTSGYDAVLGDLKDAAGGPHGNGDAALTVQPESATPNLHALARRYALADNFYASDPRLDVSTAFGDAAEATLYQQLVDAAGAARSPMTDHGDDPDDYARTGYIFNALARSRLSFRDYGGLLRLSGYSGSLYYYATPALAALSGNVDLDYAGFNPKVSDMARADEFTRDMQQYVQADKVPSFTYVWLPTGNGIDGVSDADKALGTIVDYLSKTPHWSSTAIFIVPEGVASPNDHVNALRSYALVVSPLAKRGFVGEQHLSAVSVVKTEEEIFGLGPLELNDLLASDMAKFFSKTPAAESYDAR